MLLETSVLGVMPVLRVLLEIVARGCLKRLPEALAVMVVVAVVQGMVVLAVLAVTQDILFAAAPARQLTIYPGVALLVPGALPERPEGGLVGLRLLLALQVLAQKLRVLAAVVLEEQMLETAQMLAVLGLEEPPEVEVGALQILGVLQIPGALAIQTEPLVVAVVVVGEAVRRMFAC